MYFMPQIVLYHNNKIRSYLEGKKKVISHLVTCQQKCQELDLTTTHVKELFIMLVSIINQKHDNVSKIRLIYQKLKHDNYYTSTT